MEVNSLSSSSWHSMLTRTITGILFVAVIVPCAVFGNWFYFVLIAFCSVVALREVLKAPGPQKYNVLVQIVVYVFALSFIYWNFCKGWINQPNPTNGGRFALNNLYVSMIALVLYLLVLFLISIVSPKFQLSDVTYLYSISILVALGFSGIYFLRYFPNATGIVGNHTTVIPEWDRLGIIEASNYFSKYYNHLGYNQNWSTCLMIVFVAFGTWGSDIGAYFFGLLFGKHKMNPRISPHKTWEGFFGGCLFSWVFTLGFAALMEYVFKLPLIPGLIQFQHSDLLEAMGVLHGTAWPFLVGIGFLLPIVGNVGGFLFSLVKRQYGIKDFGKILPGHGGIIDRFDSMLINSICTSFIVILTAHGWNFLL